MFLHFTALRFPSEPAAAHHETECATPAAAHCEHRDPAGNHQHETCCGGVDETQTAANWHKLSARPDAVVIVDIASQLPGTTAPLLTAKYLHRRDGPEIRVLRSHYSHNLLSYRGPPVSA